MKAGFLKLTTLLFTGLFLLASCGEMREGQRGRQVSSIGQSLLNPTQYQGEELSIAYNICLGLRTKNALYRAERLGQKFDFEITYRDCQGKKNVTDIHTELSLSGDDLLYDSDHTGIYFKEVETHETGVLENFCGEILKGEDVSNTVESAGTRYQAQFYLESGQTKVKVKTAKKDLNQNSETYNEFVTTREDVLTVNTDTDSSDSMVGLVEQRIQNIPCPGSGVESLKQDFLHHSGY